MTEPNTTRARKIVVINDELGLCTLVKIILERAGFEGLAAQDGESGLELIATVKPDLVILDDMMPGLFGFEVLKRMKSDPSMSNIPVISLSARADSQWFDQWKELGAELSLTVPFITKELVSAVTKVLGDPPRQMMPNKNWSQAVQDLRSGDGNRAVKAWDVISELAGESHFPELYALLQDDDFFVREAAAGPLARLEGVKALPSLFEAFTRGEQDGHDNDGLSVDIAGLLVSEKKKAAEMLLPMLESNDENLRVNAVWALGFVTSEISPEPLLDCFKNDPNPRIRAEAAGALGSFQLNPEVVTALLDGLHDSDADVRASVVSALGYLGDKRAVQPLLGRLHDSDEDVRASVVSALGYLSDKRAIQPLQELLKTANGNNRLRIEYALKQLGGLSVWQRFVHWATELVK